MKQPLDKFQLAMVKSTADIYKNVLLISVGLCASLMSQLLEKQIKKISVQVTFGKSVLNHKHC
jgi:hypothetical protein